MKKILIVFLSFVLSITICGCIDTEESEPIQPSEITKAENDNPIFNNEVISLNSDYISLNNVNVDIIGASFDKATGDVMKDSSMGSGFLNQSFMDSTARGFAIGFKNSSDENIRKMDAYLALYFEYSFDNNISQRDSVKPEMKIEITDDQGHELSLIYSSLDDAYINTEFPYSVILYKCYYDSTDFNININDATYHISGNLIRRP